MTDIDSALKAIANAKADLQLRIDVLEERDKQGKLIVSMYMGLTDDLKGYGANTTCKRKRIKNLREFGHAYCGTEPPGEAA